MSNLKNYCSSVCKNTGELQRFMYFHYSSQCEAKCAFLALRIYCWRLRTKIVSLIKKPHNPIDTKTLKQLSSSFGTPKQNLCYYRSTMGSISFWSCVWIKNTYPQIVPLLLKTLYFSTVSETPQKKGSKPCIFIVQLILLPHDL